MSPATFLILYVGVWLPLLPALLLALPAIAIVGASARLAWNVKKDFF